jgi:hypothetical protein
MGSSSISGSSRTDSLTVFDTGARVPETHVSEPTYLRAPVDSESRSDGMRDIISRLRLYEER